jgi:hypothetical protein
VKEKTNAEQLRPVLSIALTGSGMLINMLALGAGFKIWNDFFDNLPAKIYFEITSLTAYFLLLSTATIDLINVCLEKVILSHGTPDEKSIIQLQVDLLTLQKMLKSSPLLEFAGLIFRRVEIRQQLLAKTSCTIDTLSRFLQAHNPAINDALV